MRSAAWSLTKRQRYVVAVGVFILLLGAVEAWRYGVIAFRTHERANGRVVATLPASESLGRQRFGRLRWVSEVRFRDARGEVRSFRLRREQSRDLRDGQIVPVIYRLDHSGGRLAKGGWSAAVWLAALGACLMAWPFISRRLADRRRCHTQ